LPVLHRRVGVGNFEFLVNKVRSRLNGWEAKKLSLAGRITLAKSILFSIPNYFMSTVRIPIIVCGEIEKLARNFVWGSTSEVRKPALIKYDECCQLIKIGGLGLRNLSVQNKLFLLKLDFHLLIKTDDLWVKILRSKYRICGVLPNSIDRGNYSYVWRSLMRVWTDVVDNVYWAIGDGTLTNFWNDNWIHQVGPLRNFSVGFEEQDDTHRVCDLIDESSN
ncbi:hypothetical protein V6Z11_D04G148900, partial [Gossypium hirsutum]